MTDQIVTKSNPDSNPAACPFCGETDQFQRVYATARGTLWKCRRCLAIFSDRPRAQVAPIPNLKKLPPPPVCDCGRPAAYMMTVRTYSPQANTCGRAGRIYFCRDCRELELELRRETGAVDQPEIVPLESAELRRARYLKNKPPAKFARFSLSKQAHIRLLMASLRAAKQEYSHD